MALDASILGQELKAAAESATSNEDTWEKIAQAIIDHITTNAEVKPGTMIDGSANPITGTGTIE